MRNLALVLGAVLVFATACKKENSGSETPAATAAKPAAPAAPASAAKVPAKAATDKHAAHTAVANQAVEPEGSCAGEGGEKAHEGGDCGDMANNAENGEGKGCNQWDEAAGKVAEREVPKDAVWATLSVGGMTCGGCERRIIAKVGAMDGVLAVEADAELGQVRVAMKQGSDLKSAASERISSLGYKVQ